MRVFANTKWDLESRCASLQCFRHDLCSIGLVAHLSGAASASDLARLECELWYLESICACLRCFRHAFCASGLVAHLSGTAGASDLARLEWELRQTQNGIWNPDAS